MGPKLARILQFLVFFHRFNLDVGRENQKGLF
jgi:hypothetical protein